MIITNNIIKIKLVDYSNRDTKFAKEVKNGKYFKIANKNLHSKTVKKCTTEYSKNAQQILKKTKKCVIVKKR